MKSKLLTLALAASFSAFAQTVPTPDHVVILMLENYGYSDIIGNSNAPHINALVSDPNTAVFTNSMALTHPSQPNYIRLFSGAYQGVTSDNIPSNTPFSTCNLGATLISKGFTFKGYSEDLPSVGSLANTSGNYARKHAPWTNWQGTGTNQLPSSVGQPFTAFPSSTTYSTLPTVSFVIPNLNDDMHNPTIYTNPSTYSVTAISNGDTWVYNNLTNYITWAKTHNSLLILTFDEDDGGTPNQILTMFIGQQVQGGSYSNAIDHYSVLRTIQDMYGLTYCDSAAYATPITNIWRANTTAISQNKNATNINIWPVPAKQTLNISLGSGSANKGNISIYDLTGRLVKQEEIIINSGDNNYALDIQNINSGMYMVKVSGTEINFCKKIVIE